MALSSSKAKYRALLDASRKALSLTILLQDLYVNIEQPINIYYDNAKSIKIAKTLGMN